MIYVILQAWVLHSLARPYRGADGLHPVDWDQDGITDVAVAWEADASLSVVRGGEWATPTWSSPQVTVTWQSGHRFEDVTYHPVVGLVGAAEGGQYPGVYTYPNGVERRCNRSEEDSWSTVTTADVNNDGLMDIVAGGARGVWVWEARADRPDNCRTWSRYAVYDAGPSWPPSRPLSIEETDAGLLWTDRQRGGVWLDGTQVVAGEGALIACWWGGDLIVPRESGRLSRVDSAWNSSNIEVPWLVDEDVVAKGCAYDPSVGLVVTVWSPESPSPGLPHRVWRLFSGVWEALDPLGSILKTDEPVLLDWDLDGDLDILLTDEGENNSVWGPGVIGLENPS